MGRKRFLLAFAALSLLKAGPAPAEEGRAEGAACSDVLRCRRGLLCIDERCQRSAVEETRAEAARGREGEPCSERTPCRDGFLCMEGTCARGAGSPVDEPGQRRGSGARREGQPCRALGDCRTGLVCTQGVCEVYAPPMLVGGEVDPESGEIRRLSVGESCRPSDICDTGLQCIDGTCMRRRPEARVVDHPAPGEQPATGIEPRSAGPPEGGPQQQGSAWSRFSLEGVHGFVGLSLGSGLTGFWHTEHGFETSANLLASVKGGLMVGRWEIALEVAPYSMLLSFDGDRAIGFALSGGWLAPLTRRLSWPLRLGVGLSLGRDPLFERDLFPALQLRADLVGLVVQHGHLLFELALPSVRYHPSWDANHIWPEVSASDQTFCLGRSACGIAAPPDAGAWLFLFTVSLTYVM